jgi:hypothetical protein
MVTFHNIQKVLTFVILAGLVFLAMSVVVGCTSHSQEPSLMGTASTEKTTNADGFVQHWLILEPITANGDTQNAVQAAVKAEHFPKELTVIPHDGDKVTVDGTELTWHAVDTNEYNVNLYYFAAAYGKNANNALFWAVTIINCSQEMPGVRLAIGSNSASVWWVNGKEVIGIYGDRQTVIDDGVSKRITLKKGPNVIRGAIVNRSGAADFCARFLDSEDKPLKVFTVSVSETGK